MGTKKRPSHRAWPKWDRQCDSFSWRTGKRCTQRAIRGLNTCRRHGGAGLKAAYGWRRYLLWILLPESIRNNGVSGPVTDDEVEIVCNLLAQQIVTGDLHASATVRMHAIQYLFDAVSIEKHPDPAILLTHLSREDATMAIRILRRNGLMK